mgnify:CR=1 FL=1
MSELIDMVNRAIQHIERDLQHALTVEEVAASVHYSRFHFVRLFQGMTGETVYDYIRKRRLHEAARELLTTNKTILEIALDYQYQSHEAFSRSFKRAFGQCPRSYRQRGRYRNYRSRLTLRPAQLFLPTSQPARILPARPIFLLHHCNSESLLQRKPDKVRIYFW